MTTAHNPSRKAGRVALVTYSGDPELSRGDRLLKDALTQRGHEALPIPWDDPHTDWAAFDLCVIRSTWDYHHRLPEFLAWAERTAKVTSFWNPFDVLRWNTHKGYLRDLAARGVPVVPTLWFNKGERIDLARLLAEQGWQRAVVKPAVSASAFGTALVSADALETGQAHLNDRLAAGDVMVQPFMEAVETSMERSLLFIDGAFTHAVLRPPMLRTIETDSAKDEPSEHELVVPTAEELTLAQHVLRATGYDDLLYARVDIVQDNEGTFRLLELELVEPYLFLEYSSEAVERLAEGIVARCVEGRDAR